MRWGGEGVEVREDEPMEEEVRAGDRVPRSGRDALWSRAFDRLTEEAAALGCAGLRWRTEGGRTWAWGEGDDWLPGPPLEGDPGGRVEVAFPADLPAALRQRLARFLTGRLRALLEQLHDREETRQERAALKALLRSSRELLDVDVESPERLYARILEAAVAAVPGAEGGSLLAWSPERREFVYRAAVGFDLAALQARAIDPEGMLRWYGEGEESWRQGRPRLLIGEALRRRSALGVEDEVSRVREIEANLCVPVPFQGQVLLVLNLDSFSDPQAFSSLSVRLAHLFALQAGAIFQEVQRRRQMRQALGESHRQLQRFQLLAGAGQRLRQVEDTEVFLALLPELLGQVYGASHVAVLLLEGEELVLRHGSGEYVPLLGMRLERGQGVSWHILETGRVYRVVDPWNDPYVYRIGDEQQARVLMGAPLIPRSGGPLGVVLVGREREIPFTPEDEHLMRALAELIASTLQRIQALEEARRSAQRFQALARVNRALMGVESAEQAVREVLDVLLDVMGLDGGAYHRWRPTGTGGDGEPELLVQVGAVPDETWETPLVRRLLQESREGIPRFWTPEEEDGVGAMPLRFVAVLPVQVQQAIHGFLVVGSRQPLGWTEEDRSFLEAVADSVSVALEQVRVRAILQELVRTDPLTGVGNRRAFEERFSWEFQLASRHGHPLSLLILDLNGFKEVNDRLGHETGDRVLRQVAQTLVRVSREEDGVFRFGGDEFAILLPHTDEAGAVRAAERYARAVASLPLPQGLQITASIGMASYPEDGEELEQIWRLADHRMYARKGRQR